MNVDIFLKMLYEKNTYHLHFFNDRSCFSSQLSFKFQAFMKYSEKFGILKNFAKLLIDLISIVKIQLLFKFRDSY